MNSRQRLTPASSLHCESSGSFCVVAETTPWTLLNPAAFMTAPTDEDAPARILKASQPISADLRRACALNLFEENKMKTSAPDAFSLTIWESIVGSAVS